MSTCDIILWFCDLFMSTCNMCVNTNLALCSEEKNTFRKKLMFFFHSSRIHLSFCILSCMSNLHLKCPLLYFFLLVIFHSSSKKCIFILQFQYILYVYHICKLGTFRKPVISVYITKTTNNATIDIPYLFWNIRNHILLHFNLIQFVK